MKRIPLFILIPIVLGLIIGTFYFVSDSKEEFDITNTYVLGTLIIATLLLFIIDALDRVIENYKISILPEEEKKKALKEKDKSFFQSIYDSAFRKQSEKEERELVIDHGFDGITELDNNLPNWWLGIFYATIIYAVIYSVFVLSSDWANPPVEYETAVADFEKNYVPPTYDQFIAETTLNEGKIPAGQVLYEGKCVTCHATGGAGGAGPNLTDDYWKNQMTDDLYTNIVATVWKGVDGSAMVAFGENGDLSTEEIEQVAAYIQSLRGVKPPGNPKAPEGTLAPWVDGSNVSKQPAESNQQENEQQTPAEQLDANEQPATGETSDSIAPKAVEQVTETTTQPKV
ncbi:MAG: cbb3-type cytochrome c oxidase N-terminal domain-containing protein [Flavobacteriales bacterium]